MRLADSRIWSLSLIATLVVGGTVLPAFGAVKAGSACKKVEQVRIVKGVSLKCTKVGMRQVWRKVAAAPMVIPAVEVTPSPSPSPSASPSPTNTPTVAPTPTTPSDFLSYRNAMIYGLRDAKLIRRADSEIFFETDSRQPTEFSEIRQRAFAELNKNPNNQEHPNIEFDYEIRPSFPEPILDYLKKALDRSAALWNDYFHTKFRVKVYFVTEKDREYIKGNSWLQNNLAGVFDRYETKGTRPFSGGGAGFWQTNGQWQGNMYISFPSWVDLNYINYEWPQIAEHEFVHIVQDYAFYRNLVVRPRSLHELVQPIHFREGGANAISYLTGYRHLGWSSDALDWNFWMLTRDSKDWITIKDERDAIRVMRETECLRTCSVLSTNEPQKAFWMAYPYGAVMYEWVLGIYGLDGFKKMLDQLVTATTFDQVTRGAFGLSKDEFYAKIAPYIVETVERIKPYSN